jgi:hypothetical protein
MCGFLLVKIKMDFASLLQRFDYHLQSADSPMMARFLT